jgi:hypothetical protein
VSNRFVSVGMVSSAARIPFPSETSVSATLSKSWRVMRILPTALVLCLSLSCGLPVAKIKILSRGHPSVKEAQNRIGFSDYFRDDSLLP